MDHLLFVIQVVVVIQSEIIFCRRNLVLGLLYVRHLLSSFRCSGSIIRRIDKLVIHSIVQFAVVVDFVLPILISASCSILNQGFLINSRGLL